MKVLVVCNGFIDNIKLLVEYKGLSDKLICADGGARYLSKADITPDFLIGDFDSISDSLLREYEDRKEVEVIRYPVQKGMTDTEIAVEKAVEIGADHVYIMGATGSRLDHTLGNILLLKILLDKGVAGSIIDESNKIMLINSHIKIKEIPDWKVSLIPVFGDVKGVSTKGLFYPLYGEELKMGSSRGISNEFISTDAEITIDSGYLLIVMSKD